MISANREVIRNASMCPGGEFDGTVYLARNGTTVPAGRVTVEVVDGRNRVVNSTATEYDGFYVISKIPLVKYRIRVFTATDERTEYEN